MGKFKEMDEYCITCPYWEQDCVDCGLAFNHEECSQFKIDKMDEELGECCAELVELYIEISVLGKKSKSLETQRNKVLKEICDLLDWDSDSDDAKELKEIAVHLDKSIDFDYDDYEEDDDCDLDYWAGELMECVCGLSVKVQERNWNIVRSMLIGTM